MDQAVKQSTFEMKACFLVSIVPESVSELRGNFVGELVGDGGGYCSCRVSVVESVCCFQGNHSGSETGGTVGFDTNSMVWIESFVHKSWGQRQTQLMWTKHAQGGTNMSQRFVLGGAGNVLIENVIESDFLSDHRLKAMVQVLQCVDNFEKVGDPDMVDERKTVRSAGKASKGFRSWRTSMAPD